MERKVLRTESEAAEFLVDFNWSCFALDTETTSLNWYAQKLLGISLCDGVKTCYLTDFAIGKVILPHWFRQEPMTIIMHNATFDIKAITHTNLHIAHTGRDIEIFDTMVAAHILDEEGEKGLKYLAKKHLGKDVVSYEEAEKAGVNSKLFYEYAMNDAEWTWELAQLQKPELISQGLDKLFREVEMPFLKVLARMEMNGVQVDVGEVQRIKRELQDTLIKCESDMLDCLGLKYQIQHKLTGDIDVISPINFNSTAQLQQLLISLGCDLSQLDKTPTGSPKLDKTSLSKLRGSHPLVPILIKYKGAQKLLTAFFEPLPSMVDSDGRVRPHFNDCGTVTGRLSCSNPNLQQLPKANKDLGISTRSCFIAPKGKKLIAIDYSQQELRIMTELSQDPTLIKIIKNGGDLHLINANLVFNLGIPEEYLYETHPKYEETKKKYKSDRDKGKVFSFGIPYGMGEHKLSRDFGVSIDEAKRLLEKFFTGFPVLERAIKDTHREASSKLYVRTYTGRRRRFKLNQWGKIDNSGLRQSFNFLIQSYGADLIRMACIKLQDYADKHPDMGIKLIMTVHDEVVIEVNEDWTDFVLDKSKKIFQGCASMCVPLLAESSSGVNYDEAK